MNNVIKVLLVVFISFLSSPSWSETVTKDDLVYRDGLYYKKFTDVPFTGKVTGQRNGKVKNGKRDGLWRFYSENGQLRVKGTYKNGKQDGLHEEYHSNGQLKSIGTYKNGKQDGCWEFFYKDGSKYTSLFKNDKRQGVCP